MKKRVVIIVGPTSSGKSALAVSLARKFDGEVISADSRQVYRGLNLGTGKITKQEMKGVHHHLLDVVSPKRSFTAHDFVQHGKGAIESIVRKGKLPIVAGGSGFYIDALLGRIVLPEVPINAELRRRLEKKTAPQLFAVLHKRDPRRAKSIDPHNKRRLIRALEIADSLGQSPRPRTTLEYDALWLGIAHPIRELEKKIRNRLDQRLKDGMLAEARRLNRDGLSYKRMDTLGLEYRSLARLLKGDITRDKMAEELNTY